MADKRISELPLLSTLSDAALLPVEQDGAASAVKGSVLKSALKGTTFRPSVSAEGVLTWTNDGGLSNPAPVDLVAAVLAALPGNGGGSENTTKHNVTWELYGASCDNQVDSVADGASFSATITPQRGMTISAESYVTMDNIDITDSAVTDNEVDLVIDIESVTGEIHIYVVAYATEPISEQEAGDG